MVFLNKYLLSSPDLKLDAPLFVTWYQCVVTVALCWACGTLSQSQPHLITFPAFKPDRKISREVSSSSPLNGGPEEQTGL